MLAIQQSTVTMILVDPKICIMERMLQESWLKGLFFNNTELIKFIAAKKQVK